MITFLQGMVVEKQPTRIVLDVAGVGYEVFIPLSSYDALPGLNEPCRMLIYDHIREDLHSLFGFATEAERRMFVLLMTITGIGPKLAMCTLSGLSVRDLKTAIAGGDVKRLSGISGVGKKMAERMVVELRDKVDSEDIFGTLSGGPDLSESDAKLRDAVMALIALGYKQAIARKMVLDSLKDRNTSVLSIEDIIKIALGG